MLQTLNIILPIAFAAETYLDVELAFRTIASTVYVKLGILDVVLVEYLVEDEKTHFALLLPHRNSRRLSSLHCVWIEM